MRTEPRDPVRPITSGHHPIRLGYTISRQTDRAASDGGHRHAPDPSGTSGVRGDAGCALVVGTGRVQDVLLRHVDDLVGRRADARLCAGGCDSGVTTESEGRSDDV